MLYFSTFFKSEKLNLCTEFESSFLKNKICNIKCVLRLITNFQQYKGIPTLLFLIKLAYTPPQ